MVGDVAFFGYADFIVARAPFVIASSRNPNPDRLAHSPSPIVQTRFLNAFTIQHPHVSLVAVSVFDLRAPIATTLSHSLPPTLSHSLQLEPTLLHSLQLLTTTFPPHKMLYIRQSLRYVGIMGRPSKIRHPIPFNAYSFPVKWENEHMWEDFPLRRAVTEYLVRRNRTVARTIRQGATSAWIG